MTPAAIFRLASLASAHALTENEIATALRTARTSGPASITVDGVERAIAAVVTERTQAA